MNTEVNANYFSIELPQDLKQNLFLGLDRLSMTEGRIYKVLNDRGEVTNFFKADGFLDSIYHFFVSARMDGEDVRSLENRVSYQINSSDNIQLKALIEVTYIKALHRISMSSTWFFPREEAVSVLLREPHYTLIQSTQDKITQGQPITAEELRFLRQCYQIPRSFKNLQLDPGDRIMLSNIKDIINPIFEVIVELRKEAELANYNTLGTTQFASTLKKKHIDCTAFDPNEIGQILAAEKLIDELKNKYLALDLQSFQDIESIKNLFQIGSYSQYIQEDDSDTIADLLASESYSNFVKTFNDQEKKDLETWLKNNNSKLPTYFKNSKQELDEQLLLEKIKADLPKEALRKKYEFEAEANAPISYTSWKDIDPAYLLIIQDGDASEMTKSTIGAILPHQFYDLTPGPDSELSYLEDAFMDDWESPVTRAPYTIDAWFTFVEFCRKNKLEVYVQLHLKGAFKALYADKNAYTIDDWKNFIKVCGEHGITVDPTRDKKVFVSLCMENLISDIVNQKKNKFDPSIIAPYLEILGDNMIQNLTLPDVGGLPFRNYQELFSDSLDFQRAAIFLWNGLKKAGIVTSAPSEELIKSAKDKKITLCM